MRTVEELVRRKLEKRTPDELSSKPDPYKLRAPRGCSSVAVWAVFPHNWAGFFVALREIFSCCGLRVFGLFLQNIFLSKNIVYVAFAEVMRFVLTWNIVIAVFLVRFRSLDVRTNRSSLDSRSRDCLCVIAWAIVLILFWLKFVGYGMVCCGCIIQSITVVGNRYDE